MEWGSGGLEREEKREEAVGGGRVSEVRPHRARHVHMTVHLKNQKTSMQRSG